MKRELHLFPITSVITCVWHLWPNRVIGPYLHVFFPLLRLLPRAKEWCSMQEWSGR